METYEYSLQLRRVESQNRRLWWLVIGLTVFAAPTMAWGQTAQRAVVRARELDLCDEAGHVRGQFKEQRAELHLNDLRTNTHVAVTALDLDKLLKSRSQ